MGPPAAADPPSDAPGGRVYFPELDGLRFVAFLGVYLFHGGIPALGGWVNLLAWPLREAFPPLGRALPMDVGHALQDNGWAGVQLFFILSGYLITTLLLREERRFGRVDLRAFWARRVLRIWPLYYLTVLLGFVVLPALDGVPLSNYRMGYGRHLPWFLAFLGNWSMGLLGPAGNDAISVLWSVCVEEQFYLFVPLMVAWVPPRGRLPVVVAGMVAGVAGRYGLARAGVNPLLFQYNTLTQLDTLLSGVLLALIAFRWPPGPRAARALRLAQIPILLAALALLTRSGLAHGVPWRRAADFVGLWAIGVALIAASTFGGGWMGRALAYPRLVWLGRISYGLYMFHEVAFFLGHKALGFLGWFPNQGDLRTIGQFALTVGLASASYYGLERPFLRLKRGWTRVPSRPV